MRLESLKALSKLYNDPALTPALGPFSERFKQRLCDMCLHEPESALRQESCKILTSISSLGLLDDVESRTLLPLLVDADPKIRHIIGELAASVFEESYQDSLVQELEGSLETEDDTARFASLKGLTTLLVDVCSLAKEREDAIAVTDVSVGDVPLQITEMGSAEYDQARDIFDIECSEMGMWITRFPSQEQTKVSFLQVETAIECLHKHLPFLKVHYQ